MKKANIFMEGITVVIVIFVFAIIAVMGNQIYNDVNDNVQADPDISADAKEMMSEKSVEYPKIIDGIVVFLLVGLWIASIAFAYFIETNPIFFVISVILIVFVLFVGATLSNTFQEITSEEDLGDTPTTLPMTYFIMSHIVETLLVISISIAIALFAKQ